MRSNVLDDVFGISRDFPKNYVVRESVDGALINALTRDKHIVIYGSSKQGKTCLRKFHLRKEEHLVVTCSNKMSLAQLHSAILKTAGYAVEVTSTHSVGGEFKVAAKLGGGFNLFGNKAEAGVDADGSMSAARENESRPLELDPSDPNDIIMALDAAKSPKFITLEDFHYLPEETQNDFAIALKAFHEASKYSFIVVGVWRDQNRLVLQNGDLTGRVTSIDADRWESSDLMEVIRKGETLLNVTFDEGFKTALVSNCFNSVSILQECCRRACENSNVFETQAHARRIQDDARKLIQNAVGVNSARYSGFITHFASGFQHSSLVMFKWLLHSVLISEVSDLERGIGYSSLKKLIDDYHPNAPINQGNITQALKSVVSLQIKKNVKPIVLDYDETNRRLDVVDRSFLIWLQHQDRNELISMLEI
jgi:hypothetical protein